MTAAGTKERHQDALPGDRGRCRAGWPGAAIDLAQSRACRCCCWTTTTPFRSVRAASATPSGRWKSSIAIGVGDAVAAKGVSWNVGRTFFREEEVYNFNLLPQADHHRPGMVNLQQYYLEEY
jgi:hypothetical protein